MTVKGQAFSLEETTRIAALLDENPRLTVLAACIDAGLMHKYQTIKRALYHARTSDSDTSPGAELLEKLVPLLRAVERVSEHHIKSAEGVAGKGFSAAFYTWLLENQNPTQYAQRKVKQEISGPDGGPIPLDLSSMSHEKLIELMLQAQTVQGGGGNSE